jgi:hypothetical protein
MLSSKDKITWSPICELTKNGIATVKKFSGVYEIRQSTIYQCYRGQTHVLKIGMSRVNLRAELMNHLTRHTCKFRIMRIQGATPLKPLLYRYSLCEPVEALPLEKRLLRDFEEQHWQTPILNSTRGYSRNEDKHFEKV